MFNQVIKDASYHRDQKSPELLSPQDHTFVRQRNLRESMLHQFAHLSIRPLEHLAIKPKLIAEVLKEQTFVVPRLARDGVHTRPLKSTISKNRFCRPQHGHE